jgi:predicted enzyme related to lactoylglutathione lyase
MTDILGPDFITLIVSNLEASSKFYKDQIGLNESSEKRPNAQAFDTKPCGFAIRQSPDGRKIENPSQGIIIWFHTLDASALHNKLKGLAVPIIDGLRKSPFGMTFSFKDPDGYILTVHDGG